VGGVVIHMSNNEGETGIGQDSASGIDSVSDPQAAPSSDYKVRGKKAASSGTGVLGHNTATSGTAFGVEGVTDSTQDGAAGVRGVGTGTSGGIYGVLGLTDSPSGFGVYSDGDSKTDGNHEVTGTQSVGNVGVEAFLSSNQTIPDSSATRVTFDSTAADDTGSFDSTNNEYILPYDGDYQIDVGINWGTSFASGDNLYINTHSNNQGTIIRNSNNGPGVPYSISSKVVKGLSKGDSIFVEVIQNSGSDATVIGAGRSYTWLSVNKIA
jgi:hypothetical protein